MNTDEDCFFPQDGRPFAYWFVNDESRKREVWNYELRIMNYELRGGEWEDGPFDFRSG